MENRVQCFINDDDMKEYQKLNPSHKATLLKWIDHRITAQKSCNSKQTSYLLKHFFEQETGIFVLNGAFKVAMIESGYTPNNPYAVNATYKIRRVKEAH
jgi:hypothetical protein